MTRNSAEKLTNFMEDAAIAGLYRSGLYAVLKKEETKVWQYSHTLQPPEYGYYYRTGESTVSYLRIHLSCHMRRI